MPKSKSIFKAFKSSIGPLVASGSSSATLRSERTTATASIKSPTLTDDLVLNNLATACRITKDVAEALNKMPYIKAVSGVVAQIIKIHEEVQGNKGRCNEIISMVEKYSYTIIECLAELYTTEGEHRLEGLHAELNSFKSYLESILQSELKPLKNQSGWKAYAKREKDIEDMRRIERELSGFVDRFMMKAVAVGVSAARATKPILSEIQQSILREHWLRSQHAQYNIALVDASPGSVDRAYCAPDTRKPVLDRITTWACDRSPDSPAVFWMVGEGGAGKSTIARTIAKMLDDDNAFPNVITFFCSRKFSDTNQQVYIIPTIAYQLTGICPFYASELLSDTDIVRSIKVVSKQLDSLLVQPWENSFNRRSSDAPPFLVIIDALDEIVSQEEGDEMSGGFAFLKSLFKAIEQGYLKGIKFFITSRPHPELSEVCRALPSEAICRLYDIPTNEVEKDICRYLHQSLPKLQSPADHELLQRIAAKADGLFIFASTAVLVANLRGRATTNEQRRALQGLLGELLVHNTTRSPINNLYCQVLSDAFKLENDQTLSDRLDILHTIICTEDRVSIDVLVNIVSCDGNDLSDVEEMVKDLLDSLHAVLWISDGRITWYHASFLDFLLSPASANIALPERNLDASCNAHSRQAILARRCFDIMHSQLKFNICELPSSFLLDSEVEDLSTRIEDHISSTLRYACRYWAIHISKGRGHDVQKDVERFLDQNFLFWIEGMNLMQQSSLCATLLNITQQYAIQYFPEAFELCRDLSAASHFSTVFKGSPASKSTPHLYLSTLVYTARRFPLLKKWQTRFSCLPDIHARGISTQLLMTLQGHGSYVNSVAFSPDGSRIVSCSGDHSVRVWDAHTGEEIVSLNGYAGSVASVAFSSNGSHIASGFSDHSVRIWDVQTGEEIKRLDGHTKPVNSVAFSPDSSLIISGADDHSVRVWDIQTGEEINILSGHIDAVKSVAYSPDGSRIVSGSYDNSVRVWIAHTGEELKKLDGNTDYVQSVTFSPDSSHVLSGSHDHSVRVWDVQTGNEIQRLSSHTGTVFAVAFSPDGTRIVSGSDDRSVRVWDAQTGEEITRLDAHTGSVYSVAFSPDGSRIVSGAFDLSVRVWDARTGDQPSKLDGHTNSVNSVAFSPDGSRIVSGANDCSVRTWDVRTGEEISKLDGHTDNVNSVAFSPDSFYIVSGSDDHSVRVWEVQGAGGIKNLSGHTNPVSSVAFSPDGSHIVSGSNDNSVRIWDFQSGEEVKKLEGHSDSVKSVAFSPDGSRIVSSSYDNSMRVWDVQTGDELKKLDSSTGSIHSVAFSGSHIISGSYEPFVRFWNVQTGEEVKKLDSATGYVLSLASFSDGVHIVCGSVECSVWVWDVQTGQAIKKFNGHTYYVKSVAFSPDGSRIASGSDDASVRVWDVALPDELQQSNHSSISFSGTTNTSNSESVLLTPPIQQLNWTVNDDGWIVELPTMNRLMWLPDTLTAYLYRPANTLVISQQSVKLDFEGAKFGSDWRLCYEQ